MSMLRAIMFRRQKSNKISGFDAMNRPPTQVSVAAVQYARVDPSHRPSRRPCARGIAARSRWLIWHSRGLPF